MIVMWDVDGVLANFHKGYVTLANKMFDAKIDPDAPPRYWDSVEEAIGKDKDNAIWNYIKNSDYFWLDLEPFFDDDTAKRIANLKATQYFVTSRVGVDPKYHTETWLRKKLRITAPTVIVSNRKADAANALRANYTIDDKAGNVLVVYYNSIPERKVYVLDAPYNQFETRIAGRRIRRVASVAAFLNDVEAGR